MPQVYFNLAQDDLAVVDYLAERRGTSRSEVLCELVQEALSDRRPLRETPGVDRPPPLLGADLPPAALWPGDLGEQDRIDVQRNREEDEQ